MEIPTTDMFCPHFDAETELTEPVQPDPFKTQIEATLAMLEHQRDKLLSAIDGCPDYFARNHCRQYLASVKHALRQPPISIISAMKAFGPNGLGPGIENAVRRAEWMKANYAQVSA